MISAFLMMAAVVLGSTEPAFSVSRVDLNMFEQDLYFMAHGKGYLVVSRRGNSLALLDENKSRVARGVTTFQCRDGFFFVTPVGINGG